MPSRSGRHHNNKGLRQIKRGEAKKFIKVLSKKLGIPYGKNNTNPSLIK